MDLNVDKVSVKLAPQNPPTGVYAFATKQITEGVPVDIVETKETGGNLWDVLMGEVSDANFGGLLNKYLEGKITQETNNTPASQYTTTGNPSDQAGGQLLADLEQRAQQIETQKYLLWGGVALVAIVGLVLVVRK